METVLELAPDNVSPNSTGRFPRLWTLTTWTVLMVGIGLRFWQYLANPSIWTDEAALARNILDRNVAALFAPLDYAQVAPPGFLLAVKLSSLLFGPSEYALRLTPFIFGLASVGVFFVIAQSLLPGLAAFVATVMFCTAIPLIFFSANLKQYSTDVAVTLAVIGIALLLLRQTKVPRRLAVVFATVGIAALFLSQAAVFPLTVSGAVIFLNAAVHNRQDKWPRFLLVGVWALGVLATVAYGYRSMTVVDNTYMHKFWEQAFMPSGLTNASSWLWTTAQAVFSGPPPPRLSAFDGSLHYATPALFAALFLLGVVTILSSEREKGVLIVGPVVLALAASATGSFPVGARVSLFLVPLLLLTVVHGIDTVSRAVARQRVGQLACLLLVPFAVQTLFQQLPPRRPEHLRPVMQYVADHWQPGDAMWVYYGAGQAFEYYRRRISIPGDVQMGRLQP